MNKNFVLTVILVAFISVAIYSFSVNSLLSKGSSRLAFTSAVCVYKNGVLQGTCTHNLMTTNGLNATMGKIFGTPSQGSAPFTVIELGNLSNVTEAMLVLNNTAGNTAIADCGLTPTNVTAPIYVSSDNISLSVLWTDSGCANELVNTTALTNYTSNGSSNTMLAGKNFSTSVTLQSGDQLNVTWYVWAS